MSSKSRPSLWRVLSDTSRIISSNSLHFAALSLLFIFPISLFNVIHALLLPPSPSPSPFNSHYRRLLSTVYSNPQIPSFDKSQLRYGLALLIFNIFSVSSVTHTIFHAFHRRPLKFSSSLKSILSSFLPLLETKLIIFVTIVFDSGICMGLVFLGMVVLGLEIDPTTKSFMAVVFVMIILLAVLFVYVAVEWFLVDAIVVVESKYRFAPLERSSSLVKGMRSVAFLMITLFAILHGIMSGWFSVLTGGARTSSGGYSGCVALQMVVYAALSTVLSLFGLAATTVLFIHCKALNGESEGLEFQSNVDKLGEVYVQLSHDDVDKV